MTNDHLADQMRQPSFWLRAVIGVALSILSAVMLTIAFPPYDLWPLVWIGFVPSLLAQYRIMPRSIARPTPHSFTWATGWVGYPWPV
jgi:apolipoprotein N-acyltransferase